MSGSFSGTHGGNKGILIRGRRDVEKIIPVRDLCKSLIKDVLFGPGPVHHDSGRSEFLTPYIEADAHECVLSRWTAAPHRDNPEE